MTRTSPVKVTIVDDDHITRTLMSSVLQINGFAVDLCANAAEALRSLDRFQPAAVILDLDLGDGPSGLDVLRVLRARYPGIPAVVVTNHRSPLLIDPEGGTVPPDVPYLIKDELTSAELIVRVLRSVMDGTYVARIHNHEGDLPSITPTQASLLKQLALGLTNEEIAELRETSVRAVDRLVRRTFEALGIEAATSSAARVQAVKMYFNSGVVVRQ